MSKELELLQEALEWMHELKYVWANVRNSGDYDLLDLIAGINKIERILAQPEQPTREPLDLNKVLMSGTGNGFEYIDGFTDGVLYAEKYHCIGVNNNE